MFSYIEDRKMDYINYEMGSVTLHGKGFCDNYKNAKLSTKTQENLRYISRTFGIEWKQVYKVRVPKLSAGKRVETWSTVIEGVDKAGQYWIYNIDSFIANQTYLSKSGKKLKKVSHVLSGRVGISAWDCVEPKMQVTDFYDWFNPENEIHLRMFVKYTYDKVWPIVTMPAYVKMPAIVDITRLMSIITTHYLSEKLNIPKNYQFL